MGIISKAREVARTFSPTRWAIIALVAVLAMALLGWAITEPGRRAQRAADARAGQAFGEARTRSATDAIGTVTNNASQAGQIDDRVKGSEDAIRNAPADHRDDVTLRELCKSPSARDRPDCRVLNAGP